MKETLLIIGGIVITGAVAYGIYRVLREKPHSHPEERNTDALASADTQNQESKERVASSVSQLCQAKENVAFSMKERHSGAAQDMKNSLNNIFNQAKIENIVTENDEALDQIDDDLDDLLK